MLFYLQKIGSSHHFFQCPYTELCHIFTEFFRNETHEVYHIFRFSLKSLAKLRILCCHAHRAGIQVTDTHHDTAHGYQRSRSKAEFFRTKKRCNCHVTAAHEFSVCLNDDTASEAILKQGLMCLGKTELPGETCIVNGAFRSGSRTSIITGDQNNLGSCLCHTGCDCSHTGFGYQFD